MMHHFVPTDRQMSINYKYLFIYIQICGRRWDAHEEVGFCSQSVEIIFRAVYHTSNLLGVKAAAVQNRSVIHHIVELVCFFRSRSLHLAN